MDYNTSKCHTILKAVKKTIEFAYENYHTTRNSAFHSDIGMHPKYCVTDLNREDVETGAS
jgi:hypothetical protein